MLAPFKLARAAAPRASRTLSTAQTNLAEDFPGVPAITGKREAPTDVQVTELANGLRVASQDFNGGIASVGVYVKAGSRRDVSAGTANLLEHMAFKASLKRSALRYQRDIESFGGVFDAKATREMIAYTGSALRDHAESLVSNLSETITQPNLAYWVVGEEKAVLAEQVARLAADSSHVLVENVHAAAFGGASPMGHGLTATPGGLRALDAETLRTYLGTNFTANNMVLAGANVEHDTLVNLAQAFFPSIPEGTIEAQEKAEYAGGETTVRVEGGATQLAIGFQAPGLNDKDLYALGVLQALVGATDTRYESRLSAAAAGGFDGQAAAFAFPYSDCGLVGVAGTVADADVGAFVDTVAATLKDAANKVGAEELRRAKNQLKVRLGGDLETPAGVREELGASTLLQGAPSTFTAAAAGIDAVDADAVQRVAAAALKSAPAVSAIGGLATLPRYDTLAGKFN